MKRFLSALFAVIAFPFAISAQTGLSSTIFTNFNKLSFTVDLSAAPTNKIKINLDAGSDVTTYINDVVGGGTNGFNFWKYDTNTGVLSPSINPAFVAATNVLAYGLYAERELMLVNQGAVTLALGANDVPVAGRNTISVNGTTTTADDSLLNIDNGNGFGQLLILRNNSTNQPTFTMHQIQVQTGDATKTNRLKGDWIPQNRGESLWLWNDGFGFVEVDRTESITDFGTVTNIFQNIVVTNLTAYEITVTNVISHDRILINPTYITINGTNVATINPTDGYIPYRVNTNTFGDSPWYVPFPNSVYADGPSALFHIDLQTGISSYIGVGTGTTAFSGKYINVEPVNLQASISPDSGFLAQNVTAASAIIPVQNSAPFVWTGGSWNSTASASEAISVWNVLEPISNAGRPTGFLSLYRAVTNETPVKLFSISSEATWPNDATKYFDGSGNWSVPGGGGGGGSSLWTNLALAFQPIAQYTNFYFGADIFASGTNNAQNTTLLGNRAAYQAIFDSATHDVFGGGYYPFRASVLQGASDVSAIGQNSLATSYLTNAADIHAWGNYALFGLAATNSSNIYGKGHSAGQGVVATASGNLFFDGNESGLSSYFTNSFDISLFNGAGKSAGFTNSQNIVAFLINAGSSNMFNGSSNLFLVGSGVTVPSGAVNGAYFGPGMSMNVNQTNLWITNGYVTIQPDTGSHSNDYSSASILYRMGYAQGANANFGVVSNYDNMAFDGSRYFFVPSWDPRGGFFTPFIDAFTFDATVSTNDFSGFPVAVLSQLSGPSSGDTGSGFSAATLSLALVTRTNTVPPYAYNGSIPLSMYGAIAQDSGHGTYSAGSIGVGSVFATNSYGIVGSARGISNSVGVSGSGIVGITADKTIGGYFETVATADAAYPVKRSAALVLDNRTTGLPLIIAGTNNGTTIFQVPSDGSVAAGTTNRWQTGSDAPGASGLTLVTTNYVNITVNGVAYKLALVQ